MVIAPAHRSGRDTRGIAVDVAAVMLSVGAMCLDLLLLDEPDGAEFSAAAVITIVAASLPVFLRRYAPGWAFTLAVGLIFGVLSATGIYNTVAIPAMICGYTLTNVRGRRAGIAAIVVTIPVVVLMIQIYSTHPFIAWDTVKNLAFVAFPLALGIAAHDRRAYTTALVERAESAERTREEEALRRVGEERLRIARDVHDVVAHAMVAINVQAGVGAHLLDRDPGQARSTLRDIKRISGASLGDLRSILGLLRGNASSDTQSATLIPPTQSMTEINDLRERLGAAGIELDLELDPAIDALPAAVGATGYRIVQEALTNVMRHVGPTSARVRVTHRDDVVTIEVENDKAVDTAPLSHAGSGAGSGNGLRGMRERAIAAGGSLEAGPRSEGGWRVSASLPVDVP